MRSNLVDLTVELHHQTDKAWLISTTGVKEDAVWVPKSMGEIEINTKGFKRVCTLTVSEPVAIDKGLV